MVKKALKVTKEEEDFIRIIRKSDEQLYIALRMRRDSLKVLLRNVKVNEDRYDLERKILIVEDMIKCLPKREYQSVNDPNGFDIPRLAPEERG